MLWILFIMWWSDCAAIMFLVNFEWLCMHIMDVRDKCILIVFWQFWCWVIAYSDHYCVDVGTFGDWKLLWCSIIVVDY
jgi:hypothetical protein